MTSTPNESRLLNKISLRLIPFMMVLYVVSFLDRINVSFASLEMNKDLGFTDEAFGLGVGLFFLGYCLFGIPSNIFIERLGPRRWVAGIMIIWGCITLLFALMTTPLQFNILRVFLGVAEAGFFPGMLLYLTYWFPPQYYANAVARFMTAIPIAGIIGSATAAYALSITGVGGLAGWKWLFIITGLPAVVLGIMVLFMLPDRPHQAWWLTKEEADEVVAMVSGADRTSGAIERRPVDEKEGEAANAAADSATSVGGSGQGASQPGSTDKFLRTIGELSVWRFALLYFTLTVSMYGFQFWLPQIIKTFEQLSNTQTAILSAVPAVFQALGMLVIARHSDKTGERRFHLLTATGFTCTGLAIVCFVHDPWLRLLGLCVAAFGIWGSVGPFWALANNYLAGSDRATGIALINSIGNLGGFAGPYIVGLVKMGHNDFNAALVALAVSSALAGILGVTAPRRR